MTEPFNADKFTNDFHWHTRTAEESNRSYDARLAQVAYDLGLERGRNDGRIEAANEAYNKACMPDGGEKRIVSRYKGRGRK